MSRILIEQVKIFEKGEDPENDSALSTISGITVDGLELSKEAVSVAIENNLNLNEAYTGAITIRTINTDDDAGTAITALDDGASPAQNIVSSDGAVPKPVLLELSGSNGETIYMDDVYLMAHTDFSNSRVETVLYASRTSTDQNVIDNTNPNPA